MPTHTTSSSLEQCIAECLKCYEVCHQMAMNHCLEKGGKHVEPTHFRLMTSCAEICRTAADVMLSGAPVHAAVCAACADVCDACAESCEELGDMQACVTACRRCAESCREMAGPVHIMGGEARPGQLGSNLPA